jgi:predicted nucleic acid-binding protein
MSLIVDASVAVRWYLPEKGAAEAAAVLARDDDLIAPDLVLIEIGNAVWKRVRRAEVAVKDAVEIVGRASVDFTVLVPAVDLVVAAMELSARLDHPIYDCMYLSLAQRDGAPLITADRQLAVLAEQAGVTAELVG